MKSLIIISSAIIFVCAAASPLLAHDGDHTIHKWKCAAWKERVAKNLPHLAFAQNDEGTHCGMWYGTRYLKDAQHGALKACRVNSDTACRLIYSK